jgi:hypothetical protein
MRIANREPLFVVESEVAAPLRGGRSASETIKCSFGVKLAKVAKSAGASPRVASRYALQGLN